ncbi:unnamed protein product [Durusdinium trenchii]|uniref:ATP-dependent Clp protease proteolytic subunit n=1 Tax=Durusdinium trenchii TaxID=1381693 RepID=A0ABP0S721_9DINO
MALALGQPCRLPGWATAPTAPLRPSAQRAPLSRPAPCGVALGALAAAVHARAGRGARSVRKAEPDQPAPSREPEIDPRRQDPPGTTPPVRMPMVDTGSGEKIDVMSKLLEDRIIILGGEVKDEMAQVLVAQMLYLANLDPNQDITMYINSPGGSVSAGMAIYDTMQFIPCDVNTVCFGMAASMGSFLLAAGTKGKRKSLPNSRIMIHQPLGGAQGQALDVRIQAREILHLREILNMHLADATGQPIEQIAKDYGLIDEITPTKAWPRIQKPKRPEL